MKEWECVQVEDYKNIGAIIKGKQQNGWRLHTYACAQISVDAEANHYLLFEKGE